MTWFDAEVEGFAYPGFHPILFYGDFKKELVAYCRMFGIEPVV